MLTDESIGSPADAPPRFGPFLDARLFDTVRSSQVHLFVPRAHDSDSEAELDAEQIAAHLPGISCLGVGEYRHLAVGTPQVGCA